MPISLACKCTSRASRTPLDPIPPGGPAAAEKDNRKKKEKKKKLRPISPLFDVLVHELRFYMPESESFE